MRGRILFQLSLLLLLLPTGSFSQTIGLFMKDSAAFEGYTLFHSMAYTHTYLIDNCGRLVHEWPGSYRPGAEILLQEDGTLLRTGRMSTTWFSGGGCGGYLEKVAWDGTVLWSYLWADSVHHQHHDIEPLPNGNILLIAWEDVGREGAIANGRDSTSGFLDFWAEQVIELQPIGPDSAAVVWEWHLMDHVVQNIYPSKPNYAPVMLHPELVNINYPVSGLTDWIHMNAVAYNEKTDQIMLSSHNTNEIWIIDHSTSTAEAASHSGGKYGKGGDLLYRWGNPEAYQRGSAADQKLFGQHDPVWIADTLTHAGAVMLFNNGLGRTGAYSSVDILWLPADSTGAFADPGSGTYGPDTLIWSYVSSPTPADFYSPNISGAQRLPNGNTLVCEGASGHIFEVTLAGEMVWEYVNPVTFTGPMTQGVTPVNNANFRCYRYPAEYPGFAGKTLVPGDRIELSPLPLPADCELLGAEGNEIQTEVPIIWPNPGRDVLSILWGGEMTDCVVTDMLGRKVLEVRLHQGVQVLDVQGLGAGMYMLHVEGESRRWVKE